MLNSIAQWVIFGKYFNDYILDACREANPLKSGLLPRIVPDHHSALSANWADVALRVWDILAEHTWFVTLPSLIVCAPCLLAILWAIRTVAGRQSELMDGSLEAGIIRCQPLDADCVHGSDLL